MGVETDRELATIFSAARPGDTAEAYAFSDDGLMLTPSRFGEELTAAGVLPTSRRRQLRVPDPRARSRRQPRRPGYAPTLEPAARPLTRAAALAVAARGKAYDSRAHGRVAVHRTAAITGNEVIGVWRWLPAYDMGVIAEISTAEAFAALRYLLDQLRRDRRLRRRCRWRAALMSAAALSRLQRQFGRLQRLGAYTLERKISEGGMATIYLARHALLKRPTAIKILKKHVATDEFIHRFEREVQLASQLLHPNTVEIYDFGRTREGQPYYVMEYLDGVTLAELVAHSGPVPPGRAIHILRQVAAALREAHLHGHDPPRREAGERDAVPPRRGRRRQAARLRPREEPRAARRRATSPSSSRSSARRATWRRSGSSIRPTSTRAPTSTRWARSATSC